MSVWKGGIKKILAQINPNGGFDVNIQDQTSPLFRYFLIQEQKTNIKLSATAEVNDTLDKFTISLIGSYTVSHYWLLGMVHGLSCQTACVVPPLI